MKPMIVSLRDAIHCVCMAAGISFYVLLCGCQPRNSQSTSTSAGPDLVLRRGIGGEPASLDPAEATDTFSFEVIRDVYEGLTTESAAGTILPGVALSWTIDDTGTEYQFNLRHDAYWSNGERVRAVDFVRAWRRVVDPSVASPVADTLRPIVEAANIIAGRSPPSALGVYAPTDDLLIVKLTRPAPYFLELLTHTAAFPIFSESSARSHSPNSWISNGPYVLSDWTPGEQLRVAKSPTYWDRAHVQIDRVNYVFVSDENAELRRYLAGDLDITETLPESALALIKHELPSELHIWQFLGTAYYAINLSTPRFHTNLNLRKSLAMAVDRKRLVSDILGFGQQPAFGFVPPGTWNYSSQSWAWANMPDSQRISEARRLYTQAGYSWHKPLRLRLLLNTNPTIKKTAIAIAAMWKNVLGIETELIEQEYRVFLQTRRDRTQWDVARLGWTADYNDAGDFLDIFRTGSPNNDPQYTNAKFNDVLNFAATTPDPIVRRNSLERAEMAMLSDYPVIPIYFYVSKRLIKPYVLGAESNPLNRLYSKYLRILPH